MTYDDAAHLERFSKLPAANVSDGMDRLNVLDAAIKPVWEGARLVGRAFTLYLAAGDNKGIHEIMDQIQPGDALVINGQGATHRAVMGELVAGRLKAQGCVGAVVDGAIRDAADMKGIDFPVFARAVTPAGPYRNGPFRAQEPVAVGSVVASPGDFVIGDGDGVVIVPRDRAEEVAAAAEEKLAQEVIQRAEIGRAEVSKA